jgi:hypothetical protein
MIPGTWNKKTEQFFKSEEAKNLAHDDEGIRQHSAWGADCEYDDSELYGYSGQCFQEAKTEIFSS